MRPGEKYRILLLLCLFILLQVINIVRSQEDAESPWAYVCRNKYCSKVWKEDVQANETSANSPEICKLNCGDYGSLWPMPKNMPILNKSTTFINTPFAFNLSSVPASVSPLLVEATGIFNSYLDKMNSTSSRRDSSTIQAAAVTVSFIVQLDSIHLGLNTSEIYQMVVTTSDDDLTVGVLIIAPTYFGARHALETLSQLIAYDEVEDAYVIVSSATVIDEPIYPYRGLMMDTSRNFISIPALKRLIDGLSYNKLNTFHWHLTDTHSFPMEVTNQPNLTKYGAYSPTKTYSIADMKDLVSYARIRGVKIIPEFDQPAHIGNGWIWGPEDDQELAVCVNKDYWHQWCVEPPCGQLNPIKEEVYEVLGDIFRSMMDIFDYDVFHMGGDEVDMRCYNSTPSITDWMTKEGMGLDLNGFMELWNYFQTKAYAKLLEATPSPDNLLTILWTSELTSAHYIEQYINKSQYAVQIWTEGNDAVIPFLINAGYRVIFSNVNAWYLDCGFHNWILDSGHNWCSPYKTWQDVYENSPFKIYANWTNTTAAEEAYANGLFLGGVAPLWSESIDEHAMESRFWPRGSALAERLWSDPRSTGAGQATSRMVTNRQRYVQRGIAADRLQPEWCYQNENKCTGEGLENPPPPTPTTEPPSTTPEDTGDNDGAAGTLKFSVLSSVALAAAIILGFTF